MVARHCMLAGFDKGSEWNFEHTELKFLSTAGEKRKPKTEPRKSSTLNVDA